MCLGFVLRVTGYGLRVTCSAKQHNPLLHSLIFIFFITHNMPHTTQHWHRILHRCRTIQPTRSGAPGANPPIRCTHMQLPHFRQAVFSRGVQLCSGFKQPPARQGHFIPRQDILLPPETGTTNNPMPAGPCHVSTHFHPSGEVPALSGQGLPSPSGHPYFFPPATPRRPFRHPCPEK